MSISGWDQNRGHLRRSVDGTTMLPCTHSGGGRFEREEEGGGRGITMKEGLTRDDKEGGGMRKSSGQGNENCPSRSERPYKNRIGW